MRFERFDRAGETGSMYESKFLGDFRITDRFVEEEAKLERDERGRYRKPWQLYDLVKKHYDKDPTHPPTDCARDLRIEVIDELGLPPEEADRLKIFSALKTPLDYRFGVDGFMEYEDPETGKTARVTLDITRNARKLEEARDDGSKADVLIGVLPDAAQEELAYLKEVAKYARQIARKMRAKIDALHQRFGRRAP